MTASRTGSAKYLRNRDKVIRQAIADGVTNCPGTEANGFSCGRLLNYEVPLLDESAEADHIIAHRYGGTDDASNLRVVCRRCNRERNVAIPHAAAGAFDTLREW